MGKLLKEARTLVEYINSLKYNEFEYVPTSSYNHVGALFTDVILQAGLNYSTVVRPRVTRVIKLFPQAVTVSALEKEINNHSPEYILNWQNQEKIQRFTGLISFAKNNLIETEENFRSFLMQSPNQEKYLTLNGVGPKTLDYTLKLLAVDTVAVDRHIYTFIHKAGIPRSSYDEAKIIVEYAADLLSTSRRKLDTFIWTTMSQKRNIQQQLRF